MNCGTGSNHDRRADQWSWVPTGICECAGTGASEREALHTWGRSDGAKPDAAKPWYGEYPPAGVEPPLDEVLGNPIVHLLMRADHLVPGEALPAAIVAEPPALRVARRSISDRSL